MNCSPCAASTRACASSSIATRTTSTPLSRSAAVSHAFGRNRYCSTSTSMTAMTSRAASSFRPAQRSLKASVGSFFGCPPQSAPMCAYASTRTLRS